MLQGYRSKSNHIIYCTEDACDISMKSEVMKTVRWDHCMFVPTFSYILEYFWQSAQRARQRILIKQFI